MCIYSISIYLHKCQMYHLQLGYIKKQRSAPKRLCKSLALSVTGESISNWKMIPLIPDHLEMKHNMLKISERTWRFRERSFPYLCLTVVPLYWNRTLDLCPFTSGKKFQFICFSKDCRKPSTFTIHTRYSVANLDQKLENDPSISRTRHATQAQPHG